eukprot:TRINITY_DN8001_c0_g1_i2.p1 TRINITY_DN8001_c0_g1~~TRINITY_DN8001_c0_g1_i2.p1  ORF type:complete len:153 (-),score=31.76 TRINITY_DN8001_c0_g1_i2:30-488(-)
MCCPFAKRPKFHLTFYILGMLAGIAAMIAFPVKYQMWSTGIAGAISFIYATWLVVDMYWRHNVSGPEIITYGRESTISLHLKIAIAVLGIVGGVSGMTYYIVKGVTRHQAMHAEEFMTAVQCWMTLKWASSLFTHLYSYHAIDGGYEPINSL